jgi:hypothetical protein
LCFYWMYSCIARRDWMACSHHMPVVFSSSGSFCLVRTLIDGAIGVPFMQKNITWIPSILGSVFKAGVSRRLPIGLLEKQGLYTGQRPEASPLIWFHANTSGTILLTIIIGCSDTLAAHCMICDSICSTTCVILRFHSHQKSPSCAIFCSSHRHGQFLLVNAWCED